MPGNYSKVTTVNTGDTITASERNAEHDNHINNCDFAGIGDYSATVSQMQTTADPYPGGTESLATDGQGELARLRYLIKQITGEAQWYIDPDSDITTIVNGAITFTGNKTFSDSVGIGVSPSGTKLHIQQANSVSAAFIKMTKVGIVTWEFETGSGADIVLDNDAAGNFYFSHTGVVYFPDGTAGAPSMSFENGATLGAFRSGANQFSIASNGVEVARFDSSGVATQTRFMIYDVDNAALERVTVGAADSGGAGFKLLRIPN